MPGGEFRLSEGDWTCPDTQCGNVNFARRFNCNRCGKEKKIDRVKKQGSEIGSAAAEKSKGLFTAEDWQCAKCGNVNWARRSTCNVCNAQKFTEVEERTGLGGGFNERGVVEYKERQASDDEYDDFGRKKKKKKYQGEGDTQLPSLEPKYSAEKDNEDEDEEEEEEEEEDDGDLSKYDLWGNEDNVSKADAQPKPKQTSPRRSRSKSRSKNRSRRGRRSVSTSSSSSSSDSSRSRSRRKRRSRRSGSRNLGRRSGRRYSSSSVSSSRSRSRSSRRRKKRSRRSSDNSNSSRSRSRRDRSRGKRRH